MSEPLALVERRPLRTLPIAKEVEVALDVVALLAVKFCKVVEPVASRLSACKVPVAVMFAAVRLPVRYELPLTESVANGDVVPSPKLPPAVNTDDKFPAVL